MSTEANMANPHLIQPIQHSWISYGQRKVNGTKNILETRSKLGAEKVVLEVFHNRASL
jgi:hypothetical protein